MDAMSLPRILVVDDQYGRCPAERRHFLRKSGLAQSVEDANGQVVGLVDFCSGQSESACRVTNSYEEVARAVEQSRPDLVLLDVRFDSGEMGDGLVTGSPGDESFGEEVRDRLAEDFPELSVVMLSARSQRDLRDMDVPYVAKSGLDVRQMRLVLLEFGDITAEQFRSLLGLRDTDFTALSKDARRPYVEAVRFAMDGEPVCIVGEPGTGKEMVARLIHRHRGGTADDFLALNASTLPDGLVESELFGIAKETATGVAAKNGIFLRAEGRALFLDEIGDLPLHVQPKLLRVLQDKSVTRIGDAKPRTVAFKLVTATNKDLGALIVDGRWRRDLYDRISTHVIRVPALRDRRDDVPPLVESFFDSEARTQGKAGLHLHGDARSYLHEQDYPGNVRELRNVVKAAVAAVGHHGVVTRRVVEDCVAIRRLAAGGGKSPPAAAPAPARPRTADTPKAMAVGEVVEMLGKADVSASDASLKGIFPRLEEAYRRFSGAVVGAALERTRDPVSGRYRQSQAVSLLFGERRTTKNAQRLFNRILGRRVAATVDAEALAVLTETWRERRSDSDK